MRKFGRLMCLGLMPLLMAAAAHGAVTWTATLGFGGTVPAQGWCPVLVDIQNDGAAAKARVTVPAESADRNPNSRREMFGDRQLICSRAIELPAGGRLRCFLYVPNTSDTSVGLTVGPDRYHTRVFGRTYSRNLGSPFGTIVVIGGGPQRLLQELDGQPIQPTADGDDDGHPAYGPLISVAHVPWSDLPDRWIGWSGVTAVVLGDRQWAGASPEARVALWQWAGLGGTLIVPGGAPATAYAADLREVLPLRAETLNPQGSLAPVGRWLGQTLPPPTAVLAQGPLRAGSGTLCAAAGQPLVVTAPVGSGEIIMTAFDYSEPLVAQWTLRADLWRRLIRDWNVTGGAYRNRTSSRLEYGAGLAQLARTMPQARRLPWRGMVLYLLIYVVLLGPVQFLVMRRRGQRWSWLVTLGIIIFFALNAFVVGTALRGWKTVIYRISSIEARSGEPLGNGLGAVGLFSPGSGSCSFTTQPIVLERGGLDSLGEASSLRQDSPWRLATGQLAMWTLQVARFDFAADLHQGLQAQAVWNGSNLKVLVSNGTVLTLRQCQVVADGRSARLEGTLAPGQSTELLYLHQGEPEKPVLTDRYFGAYGPFPTPTGKPRDLAEEAMRLGRWSAGRTQALNAANPVLLAVTDDPVSPLTPTDARAQVKDITLVRVPLRATLEQGATVDVPAWLVEKRALVAGAHDAVSTTVTTPSHYLLEYRVPVGPLGATPLSLSFVMPEQTRNEHGYRGPDMPERKATEVAAFNFSAGSWQALPQDLERWRVPTPEQFLTSDGRLQVKYILPSVPPSRTDNGRQQMNTTLELEAVLRAW